MVKFWKYIQHVVIVILVIELGCFIVDKVVSEEDSISSLELALRMAKDNRTEEEQELIELRKRNRQLEMEVDILKQAALIMGRK